MIERKLRFASAFIFKRDLNSFTKILKERKLTDSKQSLAGADYFQLLNARNEESIRSVLIAIPNGNASDPLKKTLEARYGALQYFHSFEWKLKKVDREILSIFVIAIKSNALLIKLFYYLNVVNIAFSML